MWLIFQGRYGVTLKNGDVSDQMSAKSVGYLETKIKTFPYLVSTQTIHTVAYSCLARDDL